MKTRINIIFYFLLFLCVSAHAEFRAGMAVKIVTPDPLLPVSGGVGPVSYTHLTLPTISSV